MKSKTRNILCAVCAVAALACVGFAGWYLVKGKSSQEGVSAYGKVESFDYQNFQYSDGLDENGYWDGIHALDYVTLPSDVDAIPVDKSTVDPTEQDVQDRIDSLLSQYSTSQTVTDRAAENGDTVNIDYSGSVDGVAFSGGTYSGYDLTLGSNTFIDTFEDQIVGHSIGETFDVNVTFPDGYSDSTDPDGNKMVLSGKAAVFSVTINSISANVQPELTDTWVDTTFGTSDGIHTVDELRSYFSDQIYSANMDNAVVDYLLDNSTFKKIPRALIDYQIKSFLNTYYQTATAYGMDLDTIARNYGYNDADEFLASQDTRMESYAKQSLLFQAVAEQLQLEPTQEQIDQYNSYAGTYGSNYCRNVLLMDLVLDTLAAQAVVS